MVYWSQSNTGKTMVMVPYQYMIYWWFITSPYQLFLIVYISRHRSTKNDDSIPMKNHQNHHFPMVFPWFSAMKWPSPGAAATLGAGRWRLVAGGKAARGGRRCQMAWWVSMGWWVGLGWPGELESWIIYIYIRLLMAIIQLILVDQSFYPTLTNNIII
jgi:hypothetical protein